MLTIRESRQTNPAFHWHPTILDHRHLRVVHGRGYHYADENERRALALGLLILRAQRRDAKRERYLAAHDALTTDGRTCLRCNLPVGHHAA